MYLVCNKYGSHTMHGKCRVLRPCNLTDGHRSFSQDILTPTPGGLWRETLDAPPKYSKSFIRI